MTKNKNTLVCSWSEREWKLASYCKAKLCHANELSNNDGSLLPINNELKEKIETKTKTILWSMVKFINSSKEEMMAAKTLARYAPQFSRSMWKLKRQDKLCLTPTREPSEEQFLPKETMLLPSTKWPC